MTRGNITKFLFSRWLLILYLFIIVGIGGYHGIKFYIADELKKQIKLEELSKKADATSNKLEETAKKEETTENIEINTVSLTAEEVQELTLKLFEAMFVNDDNEVKRLLENGADPNIDVNPEGQGDYAINWAANQGSSQILKILLEHGADPNLDTNGTPLYWAIVAGNVANVKILLDAGADPNYVDSTNPRETPLQWAAGNEYITQLLVFAGSFEDPDENHLDLEFNLDEAIYDSHFKDYASKGIIKGIGFGIGAQRHNIVHLLGEPISSFWYGDAETQEYPSFSYIFDENNQVDTTLVYGEGQGITQGDIIELFGEVDFNNPLNGGGMDGWYLNYEMGDYTLTFLFNSEDYSEELVSMALARNP